jgi:hypothetical protein
MCYNHAYNCNRVLRLNWIATGDQARPVRSSWSLDIPDGIAASRTRDPSDVCNATVTGKCETSVGRARRETSQALTACGK